VSKDDGEGWEASSGWMHFPAIPVDTFKLAHTNGSGDALCAGFISGMLEETGTETDSTAKASPGTGNLQQPQLKTPEGLNIRSISKGLHFAWQKLKSNATGV
jgi:fructose-1-phosphate kinase PfkB-like protein